MGPVQMGKDQRFQTKTNYAKDFFFIRGGALFFNHRPIFQPPPKKKKIIVRAARLFFKIQAVFVYTVRCALLGRCFKRHWTRCRCRRRYLRFLLRPRTRGHDRDILCFLSCSAYTLKYFHIRRRSPSSLSGALSARKAPKTQALWFKLAFWNSRELCQSHPKKYFFRKTLYFDCIWCLCTVLLQMRRNEVVELQVGAFWVTEGCLPDCYLWAHLQLQQLEPWYAA